MFCEPGSEDKRDPRKHIDTVIKREVTSVLVLRAETTFLLVPLPDHKRMRRKEKKKEKVLFKNILLLSPFSLISDFTPLQKFTSCKRELLNIQIQVDALLFDKKLFKF